MKIIGEGTGRDLIALLSRNEIANMVGFYSAYGMPDDGKGIVSGAQLDVGDFYKRAKEALDAYSELRKQFETMRNQLDRLLKLMGRHPLEVKEK